MNIFINISIWFVKYNIQINTPQQVTTSLAKEDTTVVSEENRVFCQKALGHGIEPQRCSQTGWEHQLSISKKKKKKKHGQGCGPDPVTSWRLVLNSL